MKGIKKPSRTFLGILWIGLLLVIVVAVVVIFQRFKLI